LEHVFSLLAVLHQREPVIAAYHGLSNDDKVFRALSVEYLENVLPPDIRSILWARIEDIDVVVQPQDSHTERIEVELLRAQASHRFARQNAGSLKPEAAMLPGQEHREPDPNDR
jgi:hypothetical protein